MGRNDWLGGGRGEGVEGRVGMIGWRGGGEGRGEG